MTPARRRTEPTETRIPADLAGPIDVALARSIDRIPGPHALSGRFTLRGEVGRLPLLNLSSWVHRRIRLGGDGFRLEVASGHVARGISAGAGSGGELGVQAVGDAA